jgi:hypothetical protein
VQVQGLETKVSGALGPGPGEDGQESPMGSPYILVITSKLCVDRLACAGQTYPPACIVHCSGDDIIGVGQPAAANSFAGHGMRSVMIL